MVLEKLLTFLCIALVYGVNGQSLSPDVVSTAGDVSQAETISLEWTLGEMAVDFYEDDQIMLTEGFHQPLISVVEIPNDDFNVGSSNLAEDLQIEVWPNPVNSILNVKIDSEREDEVHVELLDVLGRTMSSQTILLPQVSLEFDLTDKMPGLYLLRFTEKDGTLIQSFLNIKH